MVNTKQKKATTSLRAILTRRCPSFFRYYCPDHYNSSIKMSIPTEFSDKYDIKKKVKLKNFSGKAWRVKVEPVDGVLHFTDGWSIFVEDNALQRGQLIFNYERASSFYVVVFGEDGLMKEDGEGFVDKTSARASSSAHISDISSDASVDEVASVDSASDEENNNNELEMRFCKTIRTHLKNFVTVPTKVVKKCVMKLPQKVTLRSEEGVKIVTQLREQPDRIIIGYARMLQFWEATEVKIGDILEFQPICDDDGIITEIIMKKTSSVLG